ncbi:MAG: right-handed parallel beta-helix repeat-containing protein, partial [Anaerolineae bacterium]
MCKERNSLLKALAAVILALVCLLAGAVIVGGAESKTSPTYNASFYGGTLTQDTILSTSDSPYVITQDIIVPAGITLTIEPSVTLQFQADRSIQVKGGRILAEGTITQSIVFTKYGDGYWGGILLESTQKDNRFRYAVIEYTKKVIENPRTHGISAYGSQVTIADSVLRYTQASNAIIADWGSTLYLLRNEIYDVEGDAVHATGGYAFIQGNHIHDIRHGIYALEGIELSNMVTPAIVLDNHIHDVSDDCLDLNRASAIIKRNRLYNCGDKGISIGDYPSVTTVENNLIYGCVGKDVDPYSGTGIAVKDGAVSYIANNTVSNCRHGIYLYEGHAGQGGGVATVINNILWGNRSGLDMDALSTVTVIHSNIEMDTGVWPGEGNINADPLFRAPQSGDYQLQRESPCVDAGTKTDAPDEDIEGVCRPHGAGYDMGAFEFWNDFYGGTLTESTTLVADCYP